jgi:excisionase family DNA binding protein
MSDPINTPPAAPRLRGRPPHERPLPPASQWLTAEAAAAYLNVSAATLWRAISDGRLPPPAYPGVKSPRFRVCDLDAATVRIQARPSQTAAGRQAARLAEARKQARAARSIQQQRTEAAST